MALTAVAVDPVLKARQCKPALAKEVLVHDGKQVIARHGPESITGCGNPAFVMVTGTKAEIDAEIARLKLTTANDVASIAAEREVIR